MKLKHLKSSKVKESNLIPPESEICRFILQKGKTTTKNVLKEHQRSAVNLEK